MSAEDKENATTVTVLRQDLKQWEKAFAAANGGRKAGREDIKKDTNIAAKYRHYDALRTAHSRHSRTETPHKSQEPQQKPQALRERQPNAVVSTPRKDVLEQEAQLVTQLSPVLEEEPTPAFIRNALGPTPQKDGRVLGIFDLLPSRTPSKTRIKQPIDATTNAELGVSATPSKLRPPEPALSRTPASSGKRFYLDSFAATPLKRKRGDEGTPSTSRKQFATPAFLRRSFRLASMDEMEEPDVGAPPPKKRGLVRSLSIIIRGLKQSEEQRMDDEWDVLNELEAEESGKAPRPAPKVLVDDSQPPEMPLGPDQGLAESDYDSAPDAGALDAQGRPRKVWKKKGLKRQTKRSNMKPVVHKAKKAQELQPVAEEDEEAVAETQVELRPRLERKRAAQHDQGHSDDQADMDAARGSEYSDNGEFPSDLEESSRPAKKAEIKKADASKSGEGQGTAKKAPRKISASAHANFRRLKIKNKNSKANCRGGRKFGRR